MVEAASHVFAEFKIEWGKQTQQPPVTAQHARVGAHHRCCGNTQEFYLQRLGHSRRGCKAKTCLTASLGMHGAPSPTRRKVLECDRLLLSQICAAPPWAGPERLPRSLPGRLDHEECELKQLAALPACFRSQAVVCQALCFP